MTDNLPADTACLLRKLATRVLVVAALAGLAGAAELVMALVLVAVGLLAVTNAARATAVGERRRAGG